MKFKKIRQPLLFVLAGIMTVATIGMIIYFLIFLVSHLNNAISVEVKPTESVKFNIEGFEKLNLKGK